RYDPAHALLLDLAPGGDGARRYSSRRIALDSFHAQVHAQAKSSFWATTRSNGSPSLCTRYSGPFTPTDKRRRMTSSPPTLANKAESCENVTLWLTRNLWLRMVVFLQVC